MPLISGPSYKIFITLFTGLAVGSLVGSAIFSLIPQAFNLHTIHQDGHAYLWKALVIFFGIYLFYCSERIMRIYFERRTRRKQKKQQNRHSTTTVTNNSSLQQQALDKQHDKLDSNSGKAVVVVRDIEVGTSNVQDSNNSDPLLMRRVKSEDNKAITSSKRDSNNENGDNLVLGPITRNAVIDKNNLIMKNNVINNKAEQVAAAAATAEQEEEEEEKEREENNTLAVSQHFHQHHHTHLNPHDIINSATNAMNTNSAIKTEIAPVAWMIIIGDGLHNFIDGLSIGAAFSESIYFGMSTSVAVICEEFPHELGDFAVLISSGMTVRQALGFNFLSACTCYIGMVFGILLGDMTQSASYIFALAGGMFLYIALVDMMGELSATLDEPNQSTKETMKLLLMQNIGLLTGIIVIFSLAWIDV